MKERLLQILNTLNSVEVKGRDNLSHQLGAIQEVERLILELSQTAPPAEKEPAAKEETNNGK